jgi:hypothetical protein
MVSAGEFSLRAAGVRDRLKYRNVADFIPSQAMPVIVCVTQARPFAQ